MQDVSTLKALLVYLMSGPGAGAIAYFIMDLVPFLKSLAGDAKRYIALTLSGATAVAAWFAMVGLGYIEKPMGWQGWLEAAFAVLLSIVVSQVTHAARDLRYKAKNGASLDSR